VSLTLYSEDKAAWKVARDAEAKMDKAADEAGLRDQGL
jgi:hypothetical protein